MNRVARWWWMLLLVPALIGVYRLRFNVEVLDLLPRGVAAVEGIKLYQQHFSNARELIVTITATDKDLAVNTAQSIAGKLRSDTNLVSEVTWQPPWLEHPEQTAELIAYLWFNQPTEVVSSLNARLAESNLATTLAATRDELATTLSPIEIARLSYDPFGLTRLPDEVSGVASGFGQGEEMFSSPDGKFRILFIKARSELADYRDCMVWVDAVKAAIAEGIHSDGSIESQVKIGFTGRPAFVAEMSASMRRDITLSVVGTAVIIAILFWLAHRRLKPMLWLLALLALILAGTLAFGGLIFGSINVVSMGFAAILLGLAVDYAVVHYQEALAHPDLSIPEIRRGIAPSILWAAITTIAAFLVLNLGGLPGLAQLGYLVAIGVVLSALVMIYAFLPPLFPNRRGKSQGVGAFSVRSVNSLRASVSQVIPAPGIGLIRVAFGITAALVLSCVAILISGFPGMDGSSAALQPRDSQAYEALNAIKDNLNQKRDPLWLVVAGCDEGEVVRRLDAVQPVLNQAVSRGVLGGFTIPTMLWPRPESQFANREMIGQLVARREQFRAAALAGGFSTDAMGLTDSMIETWRSASATTNVFWPTNAMCSWILDKLVAREVTNFYAVGFLFPPTNSVNASALAELGGKMSQGGVWLAGWELLGGTVLGVVKQNMWKLLLPMVGLVLLSLWLAFRRLSEIVLSLGILFISGLCLLAVMKLFGWSWNVLNLMALPLILGTGVDYSLFMQLALRRHHGDLSLAHRSVGRALLLCGGTAVAGFGSLGLSSNAGMASLGRVCAVGIAANMLISVFLLPAWWRTFAHGKSPPDDTRSTMPSSLYGARLWWLGLLVARCLPMAACEALARVAGDIYWRIASHRRQVVIQNLLPVLNGNRIAAELAARKLFINFAVKVADLWHFESGTPVDRWLGEWDGWEVFQAASQRGRGVLFVTPHLGNWEFGGAFMVKKGVRMLVLTQAEPDERLTELRQGSRARWGIETLVVGQDAFAFVEIIKRLNEGATVALLVDRPPAQTAVNVELFGRVFPASNAAAELARASGCAIVPVHVVRKGGYYSAQILTEIKYERRDIGSREARVRLTQEILRAFEPSIRQYVEQWYHFVPVWNMREEHEPPTLKPK